MRKELLTIVTILGSILFFVGCEMPVDSNSSGNSNQCWTYGEYGQIHYYNCNDPIPVSENYMEVKLAVQLPDTTDNSPYGVFFITDTTTMSAGYAIRHYCGNQTYFFITNKLVPKDCYYIAMLVSANQSQPIRFEPESGDYLGWYKVGQDKKMVCGNTGVLRINLEEVP